MKCSKIKRMGLPALAFIALLSVISSASVQHVMSIQGKAINRTSGALLTAGNVSVSIFDASTGGNLVFNDTFNNTIFNGTFNVLLGSQMQLNLTYNKMYFMELAINREIVIGSTNRRQFFATGGPNQTYLTVNENSDGNVGIGTTSPTEKLNVQGGTLLVDYPSNPLLVSTYDTRGSANYVYVLGKYAYETDGAEGLQILDVSNPRSPTLVGSYNTSGSAGEIVVSGKYAYIADGTSGLEIIDISNASSPTLIGNFATTVATTNLYLSGKYVYLTTYDYGRMLIIDVSDPTTPTHVGNYTNGQYMAGIFVLGRYAYIAARSSGLQIVDISNPSSPTLTGSYSYGGSVTANGVYVSGKYAYVTNESSDLLIFNITNPSSPLPVASYDFTGTTNQIKVYGKYAYVPNGANGLGILDISNLTSITVVGTYDTSGSAYGIFISGRYAYVTDGGSGLQIIDIGGTDTHSLQAGEIQSNYASITENVDIGNNLYVSNGLNVGPGGILTDGRLSVSNVSYFGGKVGIRSIAPNGILDVRGTTGSITVEGVVLLQIARFQNNAALLILETPTTPYDIALTNVGDTPSGFRFVTRKTAGAYQTSMVIAGDGNVGIGIIYPSATLNVNGTVVVNGSANVLALNVNNTLYVNTSSSRVGIGTTGPGGKLDIQGGNVIIGSPASEGDVIRTLQLQRNGNVRGVISTTNDELMIRGNAINFNTVDDASNNIRMYIAAGGNVGINTTSPSYALDVKSDSEIRSVGAGRTDGVEIGHTGSGNYEVSSIGTGSLRVESVGGGLSLSAGSSSDAISFEINTVPKMTLDQNGNVGIGTTTPYAGLQVNKTGTVLETNGTTLLAISGGNVGIGTTSPQQKLEVIGSVNVSTGDVLIDNLKVYAARNTTGGSVGLIGLDDGNAININRQTSGKAPNVNIGKRDVFQVTNSDFTQTHLSINKTNDFGVGTNINPDSLAGSNFIVRSTGYVGIGTTNPNATLNVRGGVNVTGSVNLATLEGKVGIGTTAPGATLELGGATGGNLWLSGQLRIAGSGGVYLSYETDRLHTYVGSGGSGSIATTILNGGNVGIGTTNPNATLNVRGGVNVTGSVNLATLEGNVGIGTTGPSEKLTIQAGNIGFINPGIATQFQINTARDDQAILIKGGTTADYVSSINLGGDSSSTAGIQLGTQSLTRMVITSGGNIGIGTTSPYAGLQVNKTGTVLETNGTTLLAINGGGVGINITSPGSLLHVKGVGAQVGSTNYYWQGFFEATSDGGGVAFGYDISNKTIGIISPGGGSGKLAFWTGHTTSWSEVMRIDENGNVGIGTTSPTSKLEVNGSANRLALNVNNTLYVNTTTSNVGIGTTSPGQLLQVSGSSSPRIQLVNTAITGNAEIDINQQGAADRTRSLMFSYGGTNTAIVSSTGTTTGNLHFETWTGSAWTTGMKLTDTGNVGIGTASPNATLQIMGAANVLALNVNNTLYVNTSSSRVGIGTASPNSTLHVDVWGSNTLAKHLIISDIATPPTDWRIYGGASTSALQIQSRSTKGLLLVPTTTGNANLIVGDNGLDIYTKANVATGTIGTLAMTITDNQTVGIGTTSPNGKLQVQSATGSVTPLEIRAVSDQATEFGVLNFTRTRDGGSTVSHNYELGQIIFDAAYTDSGLIGEAAAIKVQVDGTMTGNSLPPTRIEFYTANGTVSNVSTERMRIDKSGNLGIGTTSPGNYKLNVAGTVNASAYVTNGTDYAEWFEKLNPAEEIEAGDVVQIVKGKITKSSAKETGIFMVVTDSAGVIGNGGIVNGIPVAFIGQVRVKVSGKAIAGDYILPSGRGDGTAIAVAKAEMTLEKLMSAIGRAVESKETDRVARIKVMVGIK